MCGGERPTGEQSRNRNMRILKEQFIIEMELGLGKGTASPGLQIEVAHLHCAMTPRAPHRNFARHRWKDLLQPPAVSTAVYLTRPEALIKIKS